MQKCQQVAELEVTLTVSNEIIQNQVKYSNQLPVRRIWQNDAWRDSNRIAIVGGGPSLKNNLDQLRKYKNIMACGSVHDYLLENNIIPNWCVICDPEEIMAEYISKPCLDTDYLVASHCHKAVFDKLEHNKVFLWHAGGSPDQNKQFGFPDNDFIIGGGCTVGTRAIVLAMTGFGFYDQALFGFDSCLDGEQHHAYEFKDSSKESLGSIYEVKLDYPDSPTFKVAGYMLAQVQDFQKICKIYSGKLNTKVIGGGLIAAIIENAEKQYNEGMK